MYRYSLTKGPSLEMLNLIFHISSVHPKLFISKNCIWTLPTQHTTLRWGYTGQFLKWQFWNLHQSRHRDSATANVTHHHSYLHQTPSQDMMAANLQAARQLWCTVTCGAPSQLISLVLLTASLELLGFEIRSRQAISIPKHKVLLVSPLRCLANRAVDRGAFAISLSPSRQARNGSLLASSKLHPLSFFFMNYWWFSFFNYLAIFLGSLNASILISTDTAACVSLNLTFASQIFHQFFILSHTRGVLGTQLD